VSDNELVSTTAAIESAEKILRCAEGQVPYARSIRDGERLSASASMKASIIRTDDAVRLWRQVGRQTLVMHPAIVEECRVASSDRVPGEVLRHIPYQNPMVLFADPPTFTSWVTDTGATPHWKVPYHEEAAMRLLGFIAYGLTDGVEFGDPAAYSADMTSTHDPDAQFFAADLIFEVIDSQGHHLDVEMSSVSLRFTESGTLRETVEYCLRRFGLDASMPLDGNDALKRWWREVMSTVVGTLFYLCSTTLEAEKVPASATAHLKKTVVRKPLSLYRVGWTTGAALTRYRQSRRQWKPSEQSDVRHEQDPQHRRTHHKVVWTGKGRTIPKTAIVWAYWTKKHLLAQQGTNTIRRVPVS
jgi:hypothetical protein